MFLEFNDDEEDDKQEDDDEHKNADDDETRRRRVLITNQLICKLRCSLSRLLIVQPFVKVAYLASHDMS